MDCQCLQILGQGVKGKQFTPFQLYNYQPIPRVSYIEGYNITRPIVRMIKSTQNQEGHMRGLQHHSGHQSHANSNKNTYVGLTLKEYFNIPENKYHLDQIDEENNSELSSGTPCFGGQPSKRSKQRAVRRNRNKTDLQEMLFGDQNQIGRHGQKMATLSLQELIGVDKTSIKLPNIHQQRQRNQSRQGMQKDTKPQKKQNVKQKQQQSNGLSLAIFLKKQENIKANLARNIINARRGIRSRVTSTSFYHMNLRQKQRQRVKTEQEIEPALEKSFVVTRYGGMMARNGKKDEILGLKKIQNSFKLTKN